MSGDVQPKKRKDKRRKKDEPLTQEEPVIQQSAPQHSDDYNIHVHSDHGTGGGFCAKFIFFVLLSVLVVLIGIVITQNRGVTDLDTPVSESRFAKIFEGWLDESTPEHEGDHGGVELPDEHGEEEHADEHGDEEHDAEHDDKDEHGDEEEHDEEEEHDDEEEHADEEEHGDDEESDDEEQESAEEDQVSENKDEEDNQEVSEEQQASEEDEYIEQSLDEESEEPQEDEQDEQVDDDNEEADEDDDKTEEADNISNEDDNTHEDNNDDQYGVTSREDENDDNEDTEEDEGQPDSGKAEDDGEESEEIQAESAEADDADEADTGSQEISAENEIIEEDSAEEQTEPADDDQEEVVDNTAGEEELLKQEAEKQAATEEEYSNGKDNKTAKEEEATPPSRRHTIVPPPSLEQIEHDIQNVEDEYSEQEAEEESEEDINIEPVQSKSEYMKLQSTYRSLPSEEEDIREKIAGLIGRHTDDQAPFFDEPGDEYEDDENEEIEEGYEEEDVEIQGDENDEDEDIGEQDDREEEPEHEDDEELEYGDKEEIGTGTGDGEESEEEEEVSDVDDDALLKKLEERYGKLPDKTNNADDEEEEEEEEEQPFDSWKKAKGSGSEEQTQWKKAVPDSSKEKLKLAEARLEDNAEVALGLFQELAKQQPDNVPVKYGHARALDKLAEMKRSNELLQDAISSYYDLIRNYDLPDEMFKKVSDRCIDRMRFRGHYSAAVHVHRQLINRFPNEPKYQNQLAVTYLTINRLQEAKQVLQDVLMRWSNNGFAQVHLGFVLKTLDNDLPAAVKYLRSGIASREVGVIDGRFYFHLGDALTRLGRTNEATKVYEDGVKFKVFLSRYQRSLYNVDRLTAKPWWRLEETPYATFFKILEENWRVVRDEGLALLNKAGYFKDEAENLRDVGEWKQYELYARGMKFRDNCNKCPETCKMIDAFPDARSCKRGQVKFSVMHPGTHVWPHCGPTNCRLRAHLGLKVPPKTFIRVADQTRSWEEGKVFLFDDSFEHEVWHNGTELRLVLIVDVWHPELTAAEKLSLPAI